MTKPLKNACTVCSVQAFYFTKVWIPCLDEALTINTWIERQEKKILQMKKELRSGHRIREPTMSLKLGRL